MKTIELIVVFIFLFYRLTFSQDLSLNDLNLKGKVKSITEISYVGKQTVDGYTKVQRGWDSKWKQDTRTEFDIDGNKIMKAFYDIDSKVTRVEQFTFENGRLMKSEMLYHTRMYQYDLSGKLIIMKEINRQPSQIRVSNANIPGKERESVYSFTYNDKGTLIKKLQHDSNGLQISSTSYNYDDEGKLIKEVTMFDDYSEWFEFSYDSNGNLITESWFDSDEGKLEKTTNIYENNIKTYEYWENYDTGMLEGKISYTFEKGNVKEIIESDADEVYITWSFKYKYDSEDNWIEQVAIIVKKDKENIYIIERKIEYY